MSEAMMGRVAIGVAVLAIIAAIWQYSVATSANDRAAAAEAARSALQSQLESVIAAREASDKALEEAKAQVTAAEQAKKDLEAQ
ncbi:MAG TPA: hypothetical protein VFX46_01325, partial [Hyphomicrobiaceae bacterium]|nr:hypothetical protein [Hyphomicrobiaceae bacterium]